MKKIFLILCTFLAFYLSACSSVPVDENDPASLFKDAESEISSDHFQIAIDKLRALKNKFPYSNFAVDAQLKIADVYFLEDLFAEAAASYETFADLHPKHPKVAYALFRAAKSYFKDSPTQIARDMAPARKAIKAYESFLARFPEAPEARESQKDIATLRSLLAEKELSIGDFYFNRNLYNSSKPRYEKVIQLFPETESAKKAQKKLTELETLKPKAEDSSQNGPR